MALTQHTADTAKPRECAWEIPDSDGREAVRGLLLHILPSGRTVYYALIARGHRERIGDASQLTLKHARKKAKTIPGMAADGHDFRGERRRKRAMKENTLLAYLDGAYKEHTEQNIASGAEMIVRIKKALPHLLSKAMTDINDGIDMARWRKERSRASLETQRREPACC